VNDDKKSQALVVEDSKVLASAVGRRLRTDLDMDVIWAGTKAEAIAHLGDPQHDFAVALLDLCLPDAPNGEVIDCVVAKGIPSVVFTADFSDDAQELIWTKKVVDYVLKDGPHSVDYLIELIRRIRRNSSIKILVVDDSKAARMHLRKLLATHRYCVLEASDGNIALDVLKANPDVKLVLTDYHMPGMDGFELTKRIRSTHGIDKLGIIGLSALGNHRLSIRFMKHGANDFLAKPFLSEQLYCRVAQNITLLEQFEAVRTLSLTDSLTKLSNRRYLWEVASKLFRQRKSSDAPPTVAMIDIDHFKRVNDTYGHEAGDTVLVRIASVLAKSFRASDVVCRFGGEEFCVLAMHLGEEAARRRFELLREEIETTIVEVDRNRVNVTVSIGVSLETGDSFEDAIKSADRRLYIAKAAGRNRVVGPWADCQDEPPPPHTRRRLLSQHGTPLVTDRNARGTVSVDCCS